MLSVVLMVQLFSFCYFLDKLEIYIYLKLPFIWTKTSTSVKVQFLEKKKNGRTNRLGGSGSWEGDRDERDEEAKQQKQKKK